jgi:stage V sporulation protein G
MKITESKIVPADECRIKAYVTITFDNCLVVSQLKLIKSKKGYLVTMPARRRSDGRYLDIIYPINTKTRQMIEEKVLAEFEKITSATVRKRVIE